MRTFLKSTLVAAVLLGGATVSANAAGVGINFGNVSLGFSDGYWDNHHHWHHWAHHGDADRFRAAHGDMYHEWRHDDRNHH